MLSVFRRAVDNVRVSVVVQRAIARDTRAYGFLVLATVARIQDMGETCTNAFEVASKAIHLGMIERLKDSTVNPADVVLGFSPSDDDLRRALG